MKHIKEYNKFELDDFDDEEFEPMYNDFIGHENFYNFLEENDILNVFVKKYDPHYGDNNNMRLSQYMDKNLELSLIINAFFWNNEYYVWENINRKWRKKINEV